MGSLLGKVFRAGLNMVTPKYSTNSASQVNKGLKKLINGRQQEVGNAIRFQYGLKHAIVRGGYNESLHNYHKLSVSAFSDPKHLLEVRNKVPRCLQQAMIELSELMSRGVKI